MKPILDTLEAIRQINNRQNLYDNYGVWTKEEYEAKYGKEEDK